MADAATVLTGSNLDLLPQLPTGSIDAIVTDPPYGLAFMGKDWDKALPCPTTWAECFRVLKPGGHMVAFGAPRLYHRLAVQIEDSAPWEIRDCLMWLTGTGFPKNHDPAYTLHKEAQQKAEHDVRFVLGVYLQTPVYACEECGQVLFSILSEQGSPERWRTWPQSEAARGQQPSVEGWSYLETSERELQGCQVCTMCHGIFADGSEGRVHHGASPSDGPADREAANSNGGGSPHRPRPQQQPPEQPDAVSLERCAQKIRGQGTALKPAWEPILLARKPLEGTVARNVLAHGTGAMNIDGCRVPVEEGDSNKSWADAGKGSGKKSASDGTRAFGRGVGGLIAEPHTAGRWPANLILDEEAGAQLDAEVGNRRSSGTYNKAPAAIGFSGSTAGAIPPMYDDSGGPSRFFYCAKASRSEREAGLDDFTGGIANDGRGGTVRKNRHPTVKPIALMRWLVRLITPPGGIVLDPFNGSGSTGCAAMAEGFGYLGIEIDPEHAEIARERIDHWSGVARVHTPPKPEPGE